MSFLEGFRGLIARMEAAGPAPTTYGTGYPPMPKPFPPAPKPPPPPPPVAATNSVTLTAANGEKQTFTSEQTSKPAKAEESTMSTVPTPVPAAPTVKTENGFERFIDHFVAFIKKEAPVADQIANAAKPILALTPVGLEYDLALAGIEAAVQADLATQKAAAIPLTGVQKMALAVQVATPGISEILHSKGVVEPAMVSTAISQFVQNVYNLQTGPVAQKTA